MKNQGIQMQQTKQKQTTFNFQVQQQRVELIESIATEYLSVLSLLYGYHIEQGTRRVSDYGDMTMLDAENELRVRTIMMRGQRMRKQRELREEMQENERKLLEQLKRSQQPQ